jgi:peptidoglycan/xylan/chitin deacetylase (PgdA/CDA1 family)
VPGIERTSAAGKAVLTFDDGPDSSPGGTVAVLEALDAVDAKATFFFVGDQVADAPALAEEVMARGHEVGVHGQRHVRHDRASAAESAAEIESGHASIAQLGGTAPRYFRPPFGKLTPAAADTCRQLGLEIAYWSTWGLDWEPLRSERIAGRVIRDLDEGAIVLLHDSARYAIRPSARETAGAIEAIAAHASERGLELVTLGDACGARQPTAVA